MKTKNLLKMILVFGLTIGAFTNCTQPQGFSAVELAATEIQQVSIQETLREQEPAEIDVVLQNPEQMLSSMLKVTNITTPSARVLEEYRQRYGSLAAGNSLSMINAPLLLSTTSLAGAVCSDMIEEEKKLPGNARTFFEKISFDMSADKISDTNYYHALRGLARSFWGRNATSAEFLFMGQYKSEFIEALSNTDLAKPDSTTNLFVSACSAMLSSFDAITY